MFDKVYEIVKNKDVLVPRLLLLNYKKLNITDQEFIVLIYLLNSNKKIYNPKDIGDNLQIELMDVLTLINGLTEKGIISVDMGLEDGRKAEILNLDPLYDKLTFLIVNKEEKEDTSIFTLFEKQFARSLSPVEYDIINAWKDNGFTEEVIEEALKEAVFNGVNSLKYIDRILDDWSKKGVSSKEDVDKLRKKHIESKEKATKKEVFSYDWLNDEE